MNKYNARKTLYDGIRFDSKREAMRYKALKEKAESGAIMNLDRQVKYVLIPAQYATVNLNGKPKKKLIERELAYIADFTYHDNETGEDVVEDVKSPYLRKNALYICKRKLMLWVHHIHLVEV